MHICKNKNKQKKSKMAWQCNANVMDELSQVLAAANSTDNIVQRRVAEKLNDLYKLEDASLYLTMIFVDSERDTHVRQRWGLVLKQWVKINPIKADIILNDVQNWVFNWLSDKVKPIRETWGTVLTFLIQRRGLQNQKEILHKL